MVVGALGGRWTSRLQVLGTIRNLLDEAYQSSAGPRWVWAPGRHGSITLVFTYCPGGIPVHYSLPDTSTGGLLRIVAKRQLHHPRLVSLAGCAIEDRLRPGLVLGETP